MRVLIVWAGIAGLSCGVFLQQRGIKADIIEKKPEWAPGGFGMLFWSNGCHLLRKLGIYEEMEKEAKNYTHAQVFNQKWECLLDADIQSNCTNEWGDTIVIPRKQLTESLIETFDSKINYGIEILHRQKIDNIWHVMFTDGSSKEYDLIIAADGLHSTIREQHFGDKKKPTKWVYNLWTAHEHILKNSTGKTFIGPGQIISFFPMKGKTFITLMEHEDRIAKHGACNIDGLREGMSKEFLFRQTKAFIKGHEPMTIKQAFVEKGDWIKDDIVLIGDARHAMSPVTGFGGSMAIEDAYCLAEVLAKRDRLDRFSELRSAHMKYVLPYAKFADKCFKSRTPLESFFQQNLLKSISPKAFYKLNNRVAKHDIEHQVKEAKIGEDRETQWIPRPLGFAH